MAKRISFSASTQLSFGNLIQTQVIISENGTTQSEYTYTYNPNLFSCAMDSENVNTVTLHFGYQHSVTVDNGNLQEFYIGGSSYANPNLLASALITDISQYAIVQCNP